MCVWFRVCVCVCVDVWDVCAFEIWMCVCTCVCVCVHQSCVCECVCVHNYAHILHRDLRVQCKMLKGLYSLSVATHANAHAHAQTSYLLPPLTSDMFDLLAENIGSFTAKVLLWHSWHIVLTHSLSHKHMFTHTCTHTYTHTHTHRFVRWGRSRLKGWNPINVSFFSFK